jgi:hypothetical protein
VGLNGWIWWNSRRLGWHRFRDGDVRPDLVPAALVHEWREFGFVFCDGRTG